MHFSLEIINILFHPTYFFKNKREEELKQSILFFVLLSFITGLIFLVTYLINMIHSHMDLELYQVLFSSPLIILMKNVLFYILPILIVAILTHFFFFTKGRGRIQKTIQVFFYAQTPLAVLIILANIIYNLMIFIGPTLPFGFVSFSIYLYYSLPFFGIIWMAIISIRGIDVYYGITGSRLNITLSLFIISILLIIMLLMGYFPSTGLSYQKLTTERLNINPNETVFSTNDANQSKYILNDMGISFLFPSSWQVNTTKTIIRTGIRTCDIVFFDLGERFYNSSSLSINDGKYEFHGYGQGKINSTHHSSQPLKITATSDHSKSSETLIKKDISDLENLGYVLVNQSPILIDNYTGTLIHMNRINKYETTYYLGTNSFTKSGDSQVHDIDDIIWIEVKNMKYSFHLTAPTAGYEEYHKIFCDILNSTKFSSPSSV